MTGLAAVCILMLFGSFLFTTPVARHLISTKQQSGRRNSTAQPEDPGQHRWFGNVEDRSQGVKKFSSKQSETSSEPEGFHNERQEAQSWEYTGAGPHPSEDSGSADDPQEAEEPSPLKQGTSSDNNDEKNVLDDKAGRETSQSGETLYSKKRLSATKPKDKNNTDDRKLGSVNSFRTQGKDWAKYVEQEDGSNGRRLINDSRVTQVKESTGDINRTGNIEDGFSSHTDGLINNSYVRPHVVKSTEDQDQAEDEEELGGNLQSIGNLTNYHNSDHDIDDEDENDDDDTNSRTLSNTVMNILQSSGYTDGQAEDEEEGSHPKSVKLGENTATTHIPESTGDIKDHSEQLRDNTVTHILESTGDIKNQTEGEEDSNSEQFSDNKVTHIPLESSGDIKNQTDEDEDDLNSANLSDNKVTHIPLESSGDINNQTDEDEDDLNSEQLSDKKVTHIPLESSGDINNQTDEDEDDSNSENLSDNAVTHWDLGSSNDPTEDDEDDEEEDEDDDEDDYEDEEEDDRGSNSKTPRGNATTHVVKSTDDNEAAANKDDNAARHIVKSTKNQAEDEEEGNSNTPKHSAKPTGKNQARVVESADDKAGERSDSKSKQLNSDTAPYVAQSTGDKNVVEDEEESDSGSTRLNNDVAYDLERTSEAEDQINNVRKEDASKTWKMRNTSHVDDKDQPKLIEEGKHSENQDRGTRGEYDDLDFPSSGTDEFGFSVDGNQLERSNLVSPGTEIRVARTKIYKPDHQEDLPEEQAAEDNEGDVESYSSPEDFSDYVFSDGEQDSSAYAHFEDEQENAISRDSVQSGGVSQVKDWEDSEWSGEEEVSTSGISKSPTRYGKAAHTSLKLVHPENTQVILANLEDEIYNDGKNEVTKIYHKKTVGSKAHSKKHIQKMHMKLKVHHKDHSHQKGTLHGSTARVVHKPRLHENTSNFSSSGILVPPVMSPVIMTPVMTAPMVVTPETLPVVNDDQSTTKFTYHELSKAQQKGAVCIDGSTPRYYFRKGFGHGKSNWIMYLQGGAWCESKESCLDRSTTDLGSSLYFKDVENPGGLLSGNQTDNPTFFNWNLVYLPYCDGASFAGNRSHPVEVEGEMLYFRGKRILSAVMDDLLKSGMRHARDVVLSGTSAGGLAVMLNTDYIRHRLPTKVNLHSLADSGFFLDIPTRKGIKMFRKNMQNVFKLHDCTSGVNQKCVSSMSAKDLWKCIFPQYFLSFVKSPLYMVNPIFDSWQLENVYHLHCAYHVGKCTQKEKEEIGKFGQQAMDALNSTLHSSPMVQMYADACMDHGQVISNLKWNSIKVENMSISDAFTTWYKHANKKTLKRSVVDSTKFLDNPTCV